MRFVERFAIGLPIDLVCAYMNIAIDLSVLAHTVETDLRANDVVVRKGGGIVKSVLHMRGTREVHHAVDAVF